MILYITERNIRIDDADNQISYNSDTIAGKVYIYLYGSRHIIYDRYMDRDYKIGGTYAFN